MIARDVRSIGDGRATLEHAADGSARADETSDPRNLLTAWADLVIGAIASAGVRDVVVSPGSRSTPFLLAAARRPELTLRSVIDERSAAFFALGLARVTGRPPLLLCTSGTAPAHYYPAVIEASEAALPLVVLSADRPTELAGSGAPQTTDQVRLYGGHVRGFVDLGDPDPSIGALRGALRNVRQLVARASGPEPGPVHLNARARKPLEPVAATTAHERALDETVRGLLDRDAPSSSRVDTAVDLDAIAARLRDAARPAIVAGPLGLDALAVRAAILAFAAERGIALLPEASSQLRFGARPPALIAGDAFDLWLPSAPPDVVLEIGGTPTSATYARWLERSGPRHRYVLGGSRFRDPTGSADEVVLGDLGALIEGLARRVAPADRSDWRAAVRRAETRAWSVVDDVMAEAVSNDAAPSLTAQSDAADSPHAAEGATVRAALEALPAGALVALGNSLPIRHVDRFVRGGGRPLRVLTQRGVNGIDGGIAGAAGAAAADGGPTALVLGDVAFAHDVGALALAAATGAPLALIVLDNRGGRIFERLPIARAGLDEDALALFTTPPALDIEAAARAFGVGYVAPEPATGAAVRAALSKPGATIVHVRVPPHDAAATERRIRSNLESRS